MSILSTIRAKARGLIADAGDLFRDPLTGPHAEELVKAQRETILSRTVVLIWISVVVMPTAIGGFALVSSPDLLFPVGSIVAVAVTAVLLHRHFIVRGLFHKHYHMAMLVLVGGIMGPTGAAVLELTRNSREDFFFSYFLIFFAFTSLFPASATWILATSGALIGSRALMEFIFHGAGLGGAQVISDMLYLVELTFIGLVLNRVVCKLFFAERLAQVELALANNGLRELDRAKTEFFSNISHELRTPLTLILTPITHTLQERNDLEPEIVEVLDGARGNANRLLKMVNMLLDFSRVEAGHVEAHMSDIDIPDTLEYSASLFRGACQQRNIELLVECETPTLRVACDIDKIEQIMVNLVGNAMKFTPAGGTITIASRETEDSFEIRVEDTGIGISPANQELVFQRFGQVDEAQTRNGVKGTGIGLAMVQEYSRVLGGDVHLESEEGKGSIFRVVLPKKAATSAARPGGRRSQAVEAMQQLAVADLVLEHNQNPEVLPCENPKAKWILVVDDNHKLVRLACKILGGEFNLYTADCGERALERLASSKVDMVISDVMMPGISGVELCRRIKTDPATNMLPVILLTARGGRTNKIEGLEVGANDYIGKPFDPEELRARVRNLFEHDQLIERIREKSVELQDALDAIHREKEKLIASEKLRALGDLAAGIFHELHNYMNMIFNGAVPLVELVEMVRDEPEEVCAEDYEEIIELAKIMMEASEASLGITGELKAYAHQGTNELQAMDMNNVIRSAIRMFGKLRADSIVDLHLTDEELPIRCVPSRLLMVFTNLAKNAFEAMQTGGTVTIVTERVGDEVVVKVRDDGPGVPASFRADLFAPFKTTKSQGKGLGLGLSLAHKVVFDIGGSLSYDDNYSGGAQFVIEVPLSLGEASHSGTSDEVAEMVA